MRRTASERAALRWARWLARALGEDAAFLSTGAESRAAVVVLSEERTAAGGYGSGASAVIAELAGIEFSEGVAAVHYDEFRLVAPANAQPRGAESAEPYNSFIMLFRAE